MRFATALLATGLVLAAPAIALAHAGHDHAMAGHVAHSHQMVKIGDVTATFHFNAPTNPIYTCPMHPDVTSTKPGTCPKCKMTLAKQTHTIGIALTDKHNQPITDAKVHLDVGKKGGMVQALDLPFKGYYQGSFCLDKGTYNLTAHVKPASGKQLAFSTTYEVK